MARISVSPDETMVCYGHMLGHKFKEPGHAMCIADFDAKELKSERIGVDNPVRPVGNNDAFTHISQDRLDPVFFQFQDRQLLISILKELDVVEENGELRRDHLHEGSVVRNKELFPVGKEQDASKDTPRGTQGYFQFRRDRFSGSFLLEFRVLDESRFQVRYQRCIHFAG